MPTLSGTLSDFELDALVGKFPRIRFVPSGPGVRDSRMLTSTPVEVIPDAAGAWSVTLHATDGVVPDMWFEVLVEHLQPGGEYSHFDRLDLRVYVPEGYDGPLAELPGTPLAPNTVYVSLDPPPPGYKGWWLYSPATGQEMPLDDPLIGELRIVN